MTERGFAAIQVLRKLNTGFGELYDQQPDDLELVTDASGAALRAIAEATGGAR